MAIATEPMWSVGDTAEVAPVPRRRVRGLRFPVLPSPALLAQLAGGAGALAGVYLKFGSGITLIVGGVAAVVLGMLKEAGKV